MASRKPNILFEGTVNKQHMMEQVVGVESMFIVVYKNKPFTLRWVNSLSDTPGPKYRRTVYAKVGHAENLANRLNKEFSTTDFSVVQFPPSD